MRKGIQLIVWTPYSRREHFVRKGQNEKKCVRERKCRRRGETERGRERVVVVPLISMSVPFPLSLPVCTALDRNLLP
jgi:hypothetical protein